MKTLPCAQVTDMEGTGRERLPGPKGEAVSEGTGALDRASATARNAA